MIEEATSSKHSGTTDAPLVSVVAPCFNAEKYLEEALRSIYEQDYPNFEVIIVDDGSTDNSYAMLEQLQKVHGFQLYRQQNQGVSAALNFGLQHARGDYVATPDLDDIMLPHSLSVRAAYLDQHPEVGCVGALVIYIDSEGQEPSGRTATASASWTSTTCSATPMSAAPRCPCTEWRPCAPPASTIPRSRCRTSR